MKGRPYIYLANQISECSSPVQRRPDLWFVQSITNLAGMVGLDNTGACADGGGR